MAEIWRGIRAPRRVGSKLNSLYHRGGDSYNTAGIDIFEREWDNLYILDACRADYFQELLSNHRPSESPAVVTSRGSETKEWVEANFSGRRLHDVVYVSANSWLPKLQGSINAEVYKFISVNWDVDGSNVSTPQQVAEKALEAAERYPQKRLLVHFMQPHFPYLTEFGKNQFPNESGKDMDDIIRENEGTEEEVRRAYRENLDLVLPVALKLAKSVEGHSVISADHGELLGERQSPLPVQQYGHPGGVYVPELVNVPWLDLGGEPRTIQSGKPPEQQFDTQTIESRLRDLGYRVD